MILQSFESPGTLKTEVRVHPGCALSFKKGAFFAVTSLAVVVGNHAVGRPGATTAPGLLRAHSPHDHSILSHLSLSDFLPNSM